MEAKEVIEQLRKEIPSFKCKEGCFDCCGIAPWSKWEWGQIENKILQTELTCPYASDKGCSVYEQRPIICRLFGTTEGAALKCPHGCRPLILLSKEKEKDIVNRYLRVFRDKGSRL